MLSGYPCPCCGFLTLSEPANGTFEICPVCYWEDDNIQLDDPNYEGGANKISLNEARVNYKKHQVSDLRFLKFIRKPFQSELP